VGGAKRLTSRGLKGTLLKGVTAEIAGFGTSQLLRVVSSLVLTRVLFP
jgi:hypothetical protein